MWELGGGQTAAFVGLEGRWVGESYLKHSQRAGSAEGRAEHGKFSEEEAALFEESIA